MGLWKRHGRQSSVDRESSDKISTIVLGPEVGTYPTTDRSRAATKGAALLSSTGRFDGDRGQERNSRGRVSALAAGAVSAVPAVGVSDIDDDVDDNDIDDANDSLEFTAIDTHDKDSIVDEQEGPEQNKRQQTHRVQQHRDRSPRRSSSGDRRLRQLLGSSASTANCSSSIGREFGQRSSSSAGSGSVNNKSDRFDVDTIDIELASDSDLSGDYLDNPGGKRHRTPDHLSGTLIGRAHRSPYATATVSARGGRRITGSVSLSHLRGPGAAPGTNYTTTTSKSISPSWSEQRYVARTSHGGVRRFRSIAGAVDRIALIDDGVEEDDDSVTGTKPQDEDDAEKDSLERDIDIWSPDYSAPSIASAPDLIDKHNYQNYRRQLLLGPDSSGELSGDIANRWLWSPTFTEATTATSITNSTRSAKSIGSAGIRSNRRSVLGASSALGVTGRRQRRFKNNSAYNNWLRRRRCLSTNSIFALYAAKYPSDKLRLALRQFKHWYRQQLTYNRLSERMEFSRQAFDQWFRRRGEPLSLRTLDHYDQLVIWIAGECTYNAQYRSRYTNGTNA